MKQQALALAFVALLAAASLAPAAAATTTSTVEQTQTIQPSMMAADFANASEWTDGTNVTDFQANDSTAAYLNQTTTSNNPAVRLIDNESDETLTTWGNSSLEQTAHDTTAGTYAYRLNVTHGDLSDLDIRAGETKDVVFRYVDNTSVSAENETYTNVTVSITAASTYANYRVDDHLISTTDIVTFETDGIMGYFEDKTTSFTAENVAINGSNTTIGVNMVNSSAQSRLGSSLESVTGANWDKSTLITLTTSDDEEVLVKGYTELPDDADTNETYAMIDESSNDVTIHLGEEFDGDTSVEEVSVKTNVGWVPSFTRGLDLWVSNFELSLDHLNPFVVTPDLGALADVGSTNVPAMASLVPIVASRRTLA
ncbi:hypothetical protein [Halorubellus sp. PRR65]|uniref:hypothetical protein n=1 Tax=Halorubellus sp. PRR65 TaxID=3098148 RepID=UPI002B25867F|nr:hypothetical protein [Halorubellus sp. PRR65]